MDRRTYNLNSSKDRLESQSMDHYLLAVEAMRFVIAEFFLKTTTAIVITISCRYEYTNNYYKAFIEDLFNSMGSVVIQLVIMEKGQPAYVAGARNYNLLLVDSLQAFLDIDPIQYSKGYNTNEFYYIFLQQRDEVLVEETQAVLDYCWQNHLINCNVQVQTRQGQVLVYTYFPFQPNDCRQARPQCIRDFDRTQQEKWVVFPKKLSNLHGCSLRVATWSNPPFMTVGGAHHLDGIEGSLLQEMATHMNFSIEIVNPVDAHTESPGGEFLKGRYIEDSLQKLKQRSADIALGYIRENVTRNRLASSLFGHMQVQQVFAVLSDTQNYTSLEVFIFPYQLQTWCGIIVTVLVALVVIFTVQRGNGVAWLEFIAIVMGVGTPFNSQATHERLLNVNWSLGSFIMRSSYIAILYHLFCMNLHRKPPSTYAELLKANYSIVLTSDTQAGIEDIPNQQAMSKILIDSVNETAAFEFLINTNGGKYAAIGARQMLLYYGRQNNKAGRFHILSRPLLNQQLTIYVTKHSFLIDELNESLLWVLSAGLMEFWVRSTLDVRLFQQHNVEGEKLFQQSELNGIYQVCGCLLGVAFVVFLVELVIGRRQRRSTQ